MLSTGDQYDKQAIYDICYVLRWIHYLHLMQTNCDVFVTRTLINDIDVEVIYHYLRSAALLLIVANIPKFVSRTAL